MFSTAVFDLILLPVLPVLPATCIKEMCLTVAFVLTLLPVLKTVP